MQVTNMKNIVIYILFLLAASIILVNRFTAFYISDYRLHFVVLFIAAATLVVIIGHLFKKLKTSKSILVAFVIVGALCFFKAYFTWGGDWKTQTVLYRNINDTGNTIELQLRGDRFAFGYKKRLVEIYRLSPGMVWVADADTLALDSQKWNRVGEKLNSLQRL